MSQSLLIRERAAQEKRLWLRLTRSCNNRCLFCLDSDVQDGQTLELESLKEQIRDGHRRGCQRLILSGGEPTLHPDYLQLVAFGKQAGFDWIQTISNGRMFAYRRFAAQAQAAGLDEVTVSMHGHTAGLHDCLVSVEGAFEQSIQGLFHLMDLGLAVSLDVVINALNIEFLPEMVEFYIERGITEFDLLWMVPFGRAWKNRKLLFCDPEAATPFLQRALTRARRANVVLWTNRLPPNLLEGFEDLIQDPHKLHDEIRGRRSEFEARRETGKPLICKETERCRACFIQGLCEWMDGKDLRVVSGFISDPGKLDAAAGDMGKEIRIMLNRESREWIQKNASRLRSHPGRVLIALETYLTLEETRNRGVNPVDALKPLGGLPVQLLNLPPCLLPGADVRLGQPVAGPARDDLPGLTDHYILHHYRVFSRRCRGCSARGRCPGMPINHVRCHGFGLLNPLGAP